MQFILLMTHRVKSNLIRYRQPHLHSCITWNKSENLIFLDKKHESAYPTDMETASDLSFIDIKDYSNPANLMKEWIEEGKLYGSPPMLMNLATSDKFGKVSNRTVVIREIMSDTSLAFTCQLKSNKIKDINDNPQVAATVLIFYLKNGKNITRQVMIRYSGIAEKLSQEQCKVYFEKEKLPAKIRSWVCQQSGPTDWSDLKRKHDELLKDVLENNKVLEMPDTQVAYKIVPHEIDFGYTEGDTISDRVVFKLTDGGSTNWTCQRMMT